MTAIVQESKPVEVSSWKGSLLVSGTCIGGGMLAMPVQTADAGFLMSFLVLFSSWIFMTFTGLLLVEATLWLKERSHFSTIAQVFLGRAGKILTLVIYLFMNSASLVAYTSGGALLLEGWMQNLLGASLGYKMSCILFTLLFGGFVYLGIYVIGRVNSWFTMLMGGIYCYLVILGLFTLQPDYLTFRPAWIPAISSFPLILAAFSYQMIVPSLCSYLNYDTRRLKKAILVGSSIPFAVYFLWLLVVHGVIPFEGAGGLHEAFVNGSMIVEPLKLRFNSSGLGLLIDGFAFFALVTSYLGLSIALFDFVRDLFKSIDKYPSKQMITLVSITPCLLLAICFPRALLDFLDISGGFGDALLSGLIPVAIVWIGRYRKNLTGDYQAPGGKWALLAAGTFAFSVFAVQWYKLIW